MTETLHRLGNPSDEILNEIQQWHPDLVVVGTFGTSGFTKMIIGSVSEYLVKHSHVPVLVVP